MWHKLIQTFVDNPVNEGSPCISRKGVTVLKLKLAVASLALTSLILLLMGSTYFTAAAAIACAAMALPMGGISHVEISHSGGSLLDPFHSMDTGS